MQTINLYYQCVYSHQTWQEDNIPSWAPSFKDIWPFDDVIIQDQLANYISSTTVAMATKLVRMVTYLKRLSSFSLMCLETTQAGMFHGK